MFYKLHKAKEGAYSVDHHWSLNLSQQLPRPGNPACCGRHVSLDRRVILLIFVQLLVTYIEAKQVLLRDQTDFFFIIFASGSANLTDTMYVIF